MHYHIVWITKYRKQILIVDVDLKLREIVYEICGTECVTISKIKILLMKIRNSKLIEIVLQRL
ncbi:MAG: transposase [Deltaproteobacteria bacterium]|nr:transposase [Deltaproteobacteria bacterium]